MSHPAENAILSGLHILVVDDEPDTLELLSFVLEESGAIVTSTTFPSDAIEVCKQSKPDVLLSDLSMPGINGYTLLRRIQALPSRLGKPILAIALMRYRYEFTSEDPQAEGFQLYVTKPIDFEKLVPMIAEHVQCA
jgi:CheY-like chemotaxis protein